MIAKADRSAKRRDEGLARRARAVVAKRFVQQDATYDKRRNAIRAAREKASAKESAE